MDKQTWKIEWRKMRVAAKKVFLNGIKKLKLTLYFNVLYLALFVLIIKLVVSFLL